MQETMLSKEERRKKIWQKTAVWLPVVLLCVTLWGTAFPAIKSGYELFQIDSSQAKAVPSLLLFAGTRFIGSGLLTLLITGIMTKRVPLPIKGHGRFRDIFLLSFFQTVLQYTFFFVGLARVTGATGSILSSTSAFMAVILSAVFMANDKMTANKTLGCILGFIGVVVLNINFSAPTEIGFRWDGDGLMLLSALASAISAILTKKMMKYNEPMLLSGWQFLVGGIALAVIGAATGGELKAMSPSAYVLLAYLSFLSAAAYGLWTVLLKYHPVSKLSIFKALIPVVGTLGSGLILGESIFELRYIAALILVIAGIAVLNKERPVSKDVL